MKFVSKLMIGTAVIFGAVCLYAEEKATVANAAAKEPAIVESTSRLYKLSASDVIEVKVYQEDDLLTRVRLAQDGNVTLPLIGIVNLGGKTTEQAAVMIRDLYDKDYLVNPQVTVAVVEYSKRRFTVLGQVQRPGAYEIPVEETLTLPQAIAMAGGYTRIGSPSKVTLQRKLESGETKVFKLDADAMTKEKDAKPFEILPGDTITIGEKWL